MMEIVKLLEYSQYLRHRYLEALGKLPWEEVIRDKGASFNSLRDIFLHCVTVLDFYVNRVIRGDPTYPRINSDNYGTIEKIKTYVDQVETQANAYLSTMSPEELTRTIERKQRDGTSFTVTVEDILIDLFQEETHHRGELIALQWQMDVNPPHMGWSRYLNQ